ncbi:hypothetical protein F441_00169 [Phytophthora nicotianae CJ01A1]|uniref:Uncharacterized protein n=1 Tax=Phytophthora nicotianae CJ01A1 TaxID=1317063 RepID=W2XY70_PHYNI|nr:hypothetical protein F441_00169 [Phytophthora nicotianae CJ01A1]
MDRMPVSFCERPLVRKNAKMEPISGATLLKYIDLLYTYVPDDIALKIPENHRFQLAVNDVLVNEETLLAKIHALMKHLSTIKCRAVLRKVTPLAPAVRNATRWSSVFSMADHYTKPHRALQPMDHATISTHGIALFMLSERETAQATELLSTLYDFQEVTKALQDLTLTLIRTGITKIIIGGSLSSREQDACKGFKDSPAAPSTEETTCSFRGPSFRKRRQRAKLLYTDMRKSVDVNTLEVLMLLFYN